MLSVPQMDDFIYSDHYVAHLNLLIGAIYAYNVPFSYEIQHIHYG